MGNKTRLMQCALTTVLMLGECTAATADDMNQEKVAQCVACHGADGVGKANEYPDLQGKPVDYLIGQLRYFKSGMRKSSTMNIVAKPLSDDDMRMLAEFFNQVQ
jgi:cytochrome c553